MIKKILYLGIVFLFSCNNNSQITKEDEISCDYFNYEGLTFIISDYNVNELATMFRYKKSTNFHEKLDSLIVKVIKSKNSDKTKYTIENKPISTNFDYKLVLNDTINIYISEITSEGDYHNTMTSEKYVCSIMSYKINGQYIDKYKEIRIRLNEEEFNKEKQAVYDSYDKN